MWIMGLDFFTNYYMVFDHDNKKIGVALSKNADQHLIDITLKANRENMEVEELPQFIDVAKSFPEMAILILVIVVVMMLSAFSLLKNMDKVKKNKVNDLKLTEKKKDLNEKFL